MKTFLDLVGKQTPEENVPPNVRSELIMPRTEVGETASKGLLGAQANNPAEDKWGISDPLIQGLVARLPKPDSLWPLDERAKWLRTAAGIFDLIYETHDGDCREIGIRFVGQEAGSLTDVELTEVVGAGFNIGASSPIRR
jgi:hypothetical protein